MEESLPNLTPAGTAASKEAAPRVAFLFKEGRRARLEAGEAGPREFYYGFTELTAEGPAAALIEEGDLARGFRPRWAEPAATAVTDALFGLNADALARFLSRRSLAVLNRFEVAVATTNAQGLALALARAGGRLKARVLVLAMGILGREAPPRHRRLRRRLLREVSLAPISEAEERFLRDRLAPDQDIGYLPFGIDTRFWVPAPAAASPGDYALSIGNDPFRDYPTLALAWRPEFPPLKVVTGLPVPPAPGVEVIAGDRNRPHLSDAEVRRLYQGARLVVLPLRQTIQPSGQSACLQAMACGKAVVISEIDGLWDRRLLADGETCVLAPPASAEGLRAAVARLLADPGLAAAVGARARAAVERDATVERMAAALRRRLEGLLALGTAR